MRVKASWQEFRPVEPNGKRPDYEDEDEDEGDWALVRVLLCTPVPPLLGASPL